MFDLNPLRCDLVADGWTELVELSGRSLSLCRDGMSLLAHAHRHWVTFVLKLDDRTVAVDVRSAAQDCRRFFLCKYAVDHNGVLQLQAELPAAGLDRSTAHLVIAGLTSYAMRRQPAPRSPRETTDTDILPASEVTRYFRTLHDEGWRLKAHLSGNHWKAVYHGHERDFDVYLSIDEAWAYFQVPLLKSPVGGAAPAPGDVELVEPLPARSPGPARTAQDEEAVRRSAKLAQTSEPSHSGAPSGSADALLRLHLLRQNDEIFWAKLGMDERGQILLMLDIPLPVFDADRFRLAAQTIARYAEETAYDIQVVASMSGDSALGAFLEMAEVPGKPPFSVADAKPQAARGDS